MQLSNVKKAIYYTKMLLQNGMLCGVWCGVGVCVVCGAGVCGVCVLCVCVCGDGGLLEVK